MVFGREVDSRLAEYHLQGRIRHNRSFGHCFKVHVHCEGVMGYNCSCHCVVLMVWLVDYCQAFNLSPYCVCLILFDLLSQAASGGEEAQGVEGPPS